MPPEVRRGVTPKTNADKNIGEWNTFKITMKGDRLTIELNGITVIENALLPQIPESGPIGLQHHGSKKDGQWTRAKSFDTFCPLGPWIDTDFIPGTQKITATVNGEVKQSAALSDMIFKVPEIINFVSRVMTLLPGDIILTGTPAGIGPMVAGADATMAIEGLGELTNKVRKN
mgnify:CR=1 FL=1